MRSLYLLAAAAVLVTSTPSLATITFEPAHVSQGTLVHDAGPETTAANILADLGEKGPQIVNLNGTTSSTNELLMHKGTGQSKFKGANLHGNVYENISTGNIFLTGHAGMDWIELGLTSVSEGTVSFILTSTLGGTTSFDEAIGPGNTHFGFLAGAGDSIGNLFYSIDALPTGAPNGITDIKQVRILQSAAVVPLPEPATWAMMLAGFGAVGFAIRRSRKRHLLQLA